MISLTLSRIADVLGGTLVLRGADSADTVVSGTVDTDSRLIGPGDIFVAKPGEHADGHDFVAAAIERGAVLAIVERPLDAAITQIVVPGAVHALADLARFVVGEVRARGALRIVGITGSNGKTTTKNMMARILEAEDEVASDLPGIQHHSSHSHTSDDDHQTDDPADETPAFEIRCRILLAHAPPRFRSTKKITLPRTMSRTIRRCATNCGPIR